MADPAHIEAIQAAKAEQALREARILALRRCLAILDPQPGDHTRGYTTLLHRLREAAEHALAAEKESC